MYFALCLICDVVPFLIIVDSSFIKILTLDLIRKFDRSENDSNDIENALILKNENENLQDLAAATFVEGELIEEIQNLEENKYEELRIGSNASDNMKQNPMKYMLVHSSPNSSFDNIALTT